MNSRLDEQMMDSTLVSNNILQDVISAEEMEYKLGCELSSEDLFKIDCAILSSLKDTRDFSRDLLMQLEIGCFKTTIEKRSIDDEITKIQQEAIVDVTQPLQNMFDEMTNFVVDAFI